MFKKTGIRIVTVAIAAGMIVSGFAGCGKKEKPKQTATQTEATGKVSTLVSAKPVEVRIFLEDRPDMPWSNNMEVIKELSKRTNVNFSFELAPQGNSEEKFNILIASGDLPDILNYQYDKLIKYADKGAYEPLNELLEKDAPNIKNVINEDPKYKKELTHSDGKMYLLPNIGAIKVSEVFYLRQDWLDNLGLKTPETTDDWYTMLKTMKEKDPNGNGKQDEIPFSVRNKRANLNPFFQSWGIQHEFFIENGKVRFGSADPRMKEALIWLNKLYMQGLIDRDFLTNDAKLWQARFVNELSGVTHDWISRLSTFNVEVQKVNPKAKFVAVMPPKGPNGDRFTAWQQAKLRLDNGCAAIASTSKYKKEIVKMFDYCFSPEGSMLMNFGIEGVHYKMVNGEPVYTDLVMKNPEGKSIPAVLGAAGINRDIPMKKDMRYETQTMSAEVKDAVKLYEPIIKDAYPKLKFDDKQRETINSKYTEIKTYKDEMLDKFITGYESLDKFDEFAKKLKSMGIEDVIKVHQEAFDKYNKN